jgi:hypothetical protein
MADASAFVHGGADAQAAAQHDFSTNTNACGPCPSVHAAVVQADATRYPDPAYTALRERLAAFHGTTPQRIVLAGSGSEFIHRITAVAAALGSLLPCPRTATATTLWQRKRADCNGFVRPTRAMPRPVCNGPVSRPVRWVDLIRPCFHGRQSGSNLNRNTQ